MLTWTASQSRRIGYNHKVRVFPNINDSPHIPAKTSTKHTGFRVSAVSIVTSLDPEMRFQNIVLVL